MKPRKKNIVPVLEFNLDDRGCWYVNVDALKTMIKRGLTKQSLMSAKRVLVLGFDEAAKELKNEGAE